MGANGRQFQKDVPSDMDEIWKLPSLEIEAVKNVIYRIIWTDIYCMKAAARSPCIWSLLPLIGFGLLTSLEYQSQKPDNAEL